MSNVESRDVPGGAIGRRGYGVALGAAVIGWGFAAHLTQLHFALERDPQHQSYCNISETVNCDAVAKSAYSVLFGVPVAAWGLLAYTAAIVFAAWGLRRGRPAAALLLTLLGGVSTLSALCLACVSAFIIRAWCLECAATWIVDVTLLVAGFSALRQCTWQAGWQDLRSLVSSKRLALAAVPLGLVIAVALVFQARARVASSVPPSPSSVTAKGPSQGLTAAGHPFIGASKPKVVIEEYSDYQCPYCARAHAQLRALVERYPDAIQVIHRHFPLDNDCNRLIKRPFHTHACYYAKLAVCAQSMNRFWQANDFLFHHGRDESQVAIETVAREIGVEGKALAECLSSRATELLRGDIEAGIALQIDGTPTYVINGEKVTGPLPESLLLQYPL